MLPLIMNSVVMIKHEPVNSQRICHFKTSEFLFNYLLTCDSSIIVSKFLRKKSVARNEVKYLAYINSNFFFNNDINVV